MLLGTKEFNLPYYVFGLEYLNFEGRKISKSQNWGVFIEVENDKILIRINEKKYEIDPDYVRFYLASILPENKDSSFLVREFEEKINKDLIGNFGNFTYRVLTFVEKYFNLEIPKGKIGEREKEILKEIKNAKKEIIDLIKKFEIKKVLYKILDVSSLANKYFQESEPWKNEEVRESVAFVSANLVKDLSILFWPFIPNSSEKIFRFLNYNFNPFNSIKKVGKLELKNHKIQKPELIFIPLSLNI
jgi:methionyl-tRNA synthetase